jgi:tetratricopeptide (TPR) repeat protein
MSSAKTITTKPRTWWFFLPDKNDMKKAITILLFGFSSLFGQNLQVQNMINYLRNKDFEKAKVSADAAAEHESTRTSPKMWMNRGHVYRAIYADTAKKVRDIDMEAEEKALQAYTNCLLFDKENIYKDDVKGPLVMASSATNRKANYYIANKEYEKALKCYDLLEAALPYDFDQGMKRQNITKENIMFNKFEMYKNAGNKEKTKEFAGKLMDIKYKHPRIYTDMVRLSLIDKDTAAALSYIEKGKLQFEDNMDLIATELDIYMARKKTDVLKDKLKAAIEVSPDNEVLHFVLANLYKGTNQFELAEKEYLKAIELKPDYEAAQYNLGVLYYSAAKDWNDKLNALPLKDPKAKEYEAKSNDYFRKAVGYFETSYDINKDKKTKQILRQICLRLGETEKAEKYK